MLVVHHPDQALHDPEFVFRTGKFVDQPDRAERYRIFLNIVQEDGHEIVKAPLGSLDPVTEIHDRDYVEFLRTVYSRWAANPDYGPEVIPNVHPTHRMHRKPTELLGELGWYSNSTSCPMTEGTWPAVYASAQTAIHGADRLAASGSPVYALCRPPGHHAYPDLMTGVCFLNNAAIAANRLTKTYGKVALVDIDVHHGNGTQFIFWERPDVLFCSIHVDPRLSAPYYAGHADEIGEGAGRGLNFNQPLPWATPDPLWLEAVDAALTRVREFAPGALVLSLGFDASEHDPVATFKITNDGFAQAGRKFATLDLPTLLVQEGGYLSPHLGGYLRSFFRAFEGKAA
ncbi:histone deacetylase family protein [Microvirga brassicacearum]|uniref:Histone deacetylase family protein n=1 Tax=Microvirga brassicacearum TaxID=2580413 RepID=A0A5N3P3Y5_9HYPH|nr:histone deacetylase family protein [Microvirga brassicacearum]KAB0264445.1 histone deacetylase family protein [Microvirga brassicacearum]